MRWPLLLLALGLGCGPVEPLPSRADAILAGAADATTSSSFLLDLRFDTGSSLCSAVLVSPRVLLTAAHCVDPAFRGATTVTVRATNEPDDSALSASDFIDVTTHSLPPQWNPSEQQSPFDLAALLLARPANVAPAELLRSLPALAGQRIRVVGYGRTSASAASSSGTRRSAELPVTNLTATGIEFGSAGATGICSGDSGGPSFFRGADEVERLVGTHSFVRSASCGLGTDVRLDRHLAFIDGFISANDPPLCTSDGRCASGCMPADPDCRCQADGACEASCPAGVIDPDCRCQADGACETSCPAGVIDPDCRCRSDGACEASCPAGVIDPDCQCQANGACETSCPGGSVDPDCPADGDVCAAAAECPGGECVADARGFRFCSRPCATTDACQRGMTCQGGLCRPALGDGGITGGCQSVTGLVPLALLALGRRRRRR
jgi:V8-like Glu-specific endopeptidase